MASALAANQNDANFMVDNMITSVVYGDGHPYGEVVTPESIKNINRDLVKSYYNTFFKPNVAYLVIVGDITTKEAKKLTKEYFKKWKKGEVPAAEYAMPQPPPANTVAFAHREGAVQSVLAVAYPVELKPGDPDFIKASVMNSVLGGGVFSGRLMQNLREDKAYTYGASSSLSSDKIIGRFTARTEIGNEVTDSALVEVLFEMSRMVMDPVDQPSLDLVKNFMNGSFARSLESPRTIANFALNIERYNLPKDYYSTYLERLAAVTVEDVQQAAKKFIKPENAWIIVGGNRDEVSARLVPFTRGGDILFFDAFGRRVFRTDFEIPEGMTAEKVINNYIRAIGGSEKLNAIRDQVIKTESNMQGMTIEMVSYHKAPGKVKLLASMGDNVIQRQVFDGERGSTAMMGQNIELDEEQLNELKMRAITHIELHYDKLGYDLKLIDVDDVDGRPAYKVQVTAPGGKVATELFDVETGLKVGSYTMQESPQGPVPIIIAYGDYREIEGIKYPFSLKQYAGPQVLELNVVSVELNQGLSDDLFHID
jgi:hypothetical protein